MTKVINMHVLNSGDPFFAYLRDIFDILYEESSVPVGRSIGTDTLA